MALSGLNTKGQVAKTRAAEADAKSECLVYVGTYTNGKSKGIYGYRMDLRTGGLNSIGLVVETPNPTFLAIDTERHFLFAVNEISRFQGKAAGAVSSFSIDTQTGMLKLINQYSSVGSGPCHIQLDKEACHALVANYGSGSVAVLPIEKSGKLEEACAFNQHEGTSINSERQEGPHAHCVTLDKGNRFAFVCDLGLDKVLSYRFDLKQGTLVPNEPAFAKIHPGAGPRHLTFSPNGKHAYLVNEMSCTVNVFDYDAKHGVLKEVQTVEVLPENYKGFHSGAEIEVHPSGKFVYASARGPDLIAVFAVDARNGKLTLVERQSTRGKTPRHFGVDPTGKYLLVANQDSNNIVVFSIDASSGRLTPTGKILEVGAPVCVKFCQ
ncbi:lactonase family protein [Pedosphaera parvula]|nr:lactonase family protein [Pedosphaera parvula]